MRKFRFVGDPSEYDWDISPIVGNIYPENHFGTKDGLPFNPLNYVDQFEKEEWIDYPESWEEVLDESK